MFEINEILMNQDVEEKHFNSLSNIMFDDDMMSLAKLSNFKKV